MKDGKFEDSLFYIGCFINYDINTLKNAKDGPEETASHTNAIIVIQD